MISVPAAAGRPPLLVTVDTEGDNLWSRPRSVTTENARYLPRFHELCRRHGLRPVYLSSFEMVGCPEFLRFGRDVLAGNEGEIGMHPHAWNSPPDVRLTDDDHQRQPYITMYPDNVIRQKIGRLTRALEDAFQTSIRSHRGGRWAFDETCARVLAESGYWVDCSVTPHVNWRRDSGGRIDRDAPDYSQFPVDPYFVDLDDIRRPGPSRLLEVPVTTCRIELDRHGAETATPTPYVARWLRPNGRNLKALRWVVQRARQEARSYLMLVVHSSELMPGGSPGLPHKDDVEALYRDLESLFAAMSGSWRGSTLSEFYLEIVRQSDRPPVGHG